MKNLLIATALILTTATSTVFAAETSKVSKASASEKYQKISGVEASDILLKVLRQGVQSSPDSIEGFLSSVEFSALLRIAGENKESEELTIKSAKKAISTLGDLTYIFEAYNQEGKKDVTLVISVRKINGKDTYTVLTQNH